MDSTIAASKPFIFIIGPHGREFTIHSAAVANQSQVLDMLVNGACQEDVPGRATWEDVDEDTFVCFWQFVYTGDYDIPCVYVLSDTPIDEGTDEATLNPNEVRIALPADEGLFEPELAEPQPSHELESADEANDFWGLRGSKLKKKKGRSEKPPTKQERLWSRFVEFQRHGSGQHTSYEEQDVVVAGHRQEDLVCHAKIYVFAECYGIAKLMTLSHKKLHQCLIDMSHTWVLADVVRLVQFCYASPVPDGLRELVVLFAACKFEWLWHETRFQELLETHAKLSKDLLESLRNRLD